MLSDNTDDIPYKARLVADEDWNDFTKSCESPHGHDWRLVTDVYQCPNCGRIRIEKPAGCVFFFEPENSSVPRSLFRSVKRSWRPSKV